MATITISVDDDIEKEFRETARKKLGTGKGMLGKAIGAAIKKWVEEEKQKEVARKGRELTVKGLYKLKAWKFRREELYERG